MTIAKDIATKLSVAFVAAAMIFMSFASAAKAQTAEELQQLINDLLAQVASLQGQLGGGSTATPAAGVCPYTWTRDLSTGATGADVKMLQMFLNADPDTRVSATGVGSAGMETEYYGPATAAAVSKLQVKYRADVLSPAGLVNPTGYFGPGTRAKANGLCVAPTTPTVPTTPTTPDPVTPDPVDDEDNNDDEDDMTLRGEADLDKVELDSASDDQLEEGAEDAEIAEVTVEFADGDAEISRIDLSLVGDNANDETDPWDVFETISLWVDGDKIAEENADDKDDYLDDNDGTLRFSGLDLVGMEDEEVVITVAATLQNSLDGVNNGEDWEVSIDSLRYFDADGVATTDTTTGDMGDSVSFSIEAAGFEDEIKVKTSNNDPDASTLQVEDDKKSDWYTVFRFDLDTDNSVNDIEINELWITVNLSTSTYAARVDDAELVIDGVTIDSFTASTTAVATTTVLKFDVDGDVVIDAGDRVEAELNLRFEALPVGFEGMTVQAELLSADATANDSDTGYIDAEGADDLDDTQVSGSADGDEHTLRTAGVDVSVNGTDSSVTVNDGATDDYGTYEIEVEITAFEQDVYIDTDPAVGVVYHLETGAGATVSIGTSTAVLTSSADETGGFFEITEGSTETLTLTVTFTPGAANTQARLVLDSIEFAPSAIAPTQTQTTLPATDYRTDVETMVN